MNPVGKILLFLIAAAAVVFAVANRAMVTVSLWPLPFDVSLPLFMAVLGALALGLVLGTMLSLPARERLRRRARTSEKRAEKLAPAKGPAISKTAQGGAGEAEVIGTQPALPRPRRTDNRPTENGQSAGAGSP